MAFTMPNYPMLTNEQVNPFHGALQTALQMMQQVPKSVYSAPMAQQEMQKAILANQWNPKIWQSEIGLRGAQAGLAGAEANKQRFLVEHPQYISPEGMLIQQALQNQKRMGGQGGQGGGGYGGSDQQTSGMPQGQSEEGQQQEAPQGQSEGGQQQQYDPNALAYNPPQLASPTGVSSLDSYYFKKFGMSPVAQAQMDLAKSQAEKYQSENIKRSAELNNQAIGANESALQAQTFLHALDQVGTLQTGIWAGKSPAFTDAAQKMDKANARLTEAAAKMLQSGHSVHEADLALEKIATPGRQLNKDVAFDLANGVIAKQNRVKEQQQFYAAGAQMRIKPEILDAMWNKYETDRPYMNTDTYMPNDSYANSWRDYLSPQAVNSFLSGKDYKPQNQAALSGMNWTESDLKKVRKWATKNHLNPDHFNKQNIYKSARKNGEPLSNIKMKLMQRGAL